LSTGCAFRVCLNSGREYLSLESPLFNFPDHGIFVRTSRDSLFSFQARIVGRGALCLNLLLQPRLRIFVKYERGSTRKTGEFVVFRILYYALLTGVAFVPRLESVQDLPVVICRMLVKIWFIVSRLPHWRSEKIPHHKRERGGVGLHSHFSSSPCQKAKGARISILRSTGW